MSQKINARLLAQLKKKIKRATIKQVADELELKSHATLINWFKTKNIPERRHEKIKEVCK